jgi:dihydrofolate synthase/folylpolyglutamate synthase
MHSNQQIATILKELEQRRGKAIELGLSRTRELLERLGKPHESLPPVVHIAGTNGKGSVAAFLTAILQAAGYRVHRYTSPHLISFRERILLAGEPISEHVFLEVLQKVRPHSGALNATFFESTTAAAYLAFAQTPADICILETGLGGRLDATNVIDRPELCVITPISYDHQEFLGDTLEQIATEKAGIIKEGVPCVVAPQAEGAAGVLMETSATRHAPCIAHGKDWFFEQVREMLSVRHNDNDIENATIGIEGVHQYMNAATAVVAAWQFERFNIPESAIRSGLSQVKWPARLQPITDGILPELLPDYCSLWLDGGHNQSAGKALAGWMHSRNRPVHIICGMVSEKHHAEFLQPIGQNAASLTFVDIPGEPRTMAAVSLQAIARELFAQQDIRAAVSIPDALQTVGSQALAACDILICGSLYLAGHVLAINDEQKGAGL